MSSIKPRWETYSDEIIGKDDPFLEKEVEAYSKKRYNEKSSTQNLEELARWEEGNREIAKEYQFVRPEEYDNESARIGRVMSHDDFIQILRTKLHLTCFYREMNHPQKIALWISRNGISAPECCGWVKRGLTTELSIMRFDAHGVPLDEKFRGWRTVLMNLVKNGFLEEHDVRKVFGRAKGPCGERYNAFMQAVRTVV